MDLSKIVGVLTLLAPSACYQGLDPAAHDGLGATGDTTADGAEDDPPESSDSDCIPVEAQRTSLRRLTASEYRNTVLDLLGIDAAEVVTSFPADPRIDGFDNNAAAQTIGLAHVSRYQAAAEWITTQALGDGPAVLGCDPSQLECRDRFIDERAPLLWRRPLSDDERERLRALAQAAPDGDPRTGLGLVLRAVLQSPHMLLRPEPGGSAGQRTGFEVATRLSYFLWQSAPDAALHQRAAQGDLDTSQGVAEVVRAMWADARSARGRAGFTEGWLRLERLATAVRDPELHPEWTPELRDALAREPTTLVERHAQSEDDFLGVLTTTLLPIDEVTAPLYGVPAPDAPSELEFDDPWRGGLLGSAAVMALTTPSDVTSPVARGLWVRMVMLCESLPPPPPDVEVDPIDDDMLGPSKADELQAHRADPVCAGCHDLVDPIGLGLERYDALGRLRERDERGDLAPTEGSIGGVPDSDFEGARELGEVLRDAPQTRACVATQMFRWAHGRSETPADACTLEAAAAAFEDRGHLEDLAVAIVMSDLFDG